MRLVSVYDEPCAAELLYKLLAEREPWQSISHKGMPSFEQHAAFVASVPYLAWYLIKIEHACVGSVYLTKQSEVGIFIFRVHHRHGYAAQAIKALRELHPGRMLANVNPDNAASIHLFERLGGKLIQQTYELP